MLHSVSKYRSAIMGTAILWVMVYHSGLFLQGGLPAKILTYLQRNGYGGVDLFLFVSGFGLYLSLARNPGTGAFYRRRLVRLMPAYLPVLAVFLALRLPETPPATWPASILGNCTGLALLSGCPVRFNWYMLALPFYYLAAPPFAALLNRRGGRGWLYLLGVTALLDLTFLGGYLMIVVSRFTIFAVGMMAGQRFFEEKSFPPAAEAAAVLTGACAFLVQIRLPAYFSGDFMWNYGLYWFPMILAAPAAICVLCRAFSLLDRCAPGRLAVRFLSHTGVCSLEIYLIHIVLFDYLRLSSNWLWCGVFLSMVLSGFAFHWLTGQAAARLAARRRPAGIS